jgi:hypothetical protein
MMIVCRFCRRLSRQRIAAAGMVTILARKTDEAAIHQPAGQQLPP